MLACCSTGTNRTSDENSFQTIHIMRPSSNSRQWIDFDGIDLDEFNEEMDRRIMENHAHVIDLLVLTLVLRPRTLNPRLHTGLYTTFTLAQRRDPIRIC